MLEIHLRQPGYTYSVCGLFNKNKERIQKFKETGDSSFFQHDITYGYFKDITRRTAFDKKLRDKAFSIAKNPKYEEYHGVLLQWLINVLIKKLLEEELKMRICLIKN